MPGHTIRRPAAPVPPFAMSASRLMSAAVLGTSRATPRGSCGRMAGGLTSTAARRRASSRAPSRILLHASAGTSVDFDSGATKASGEGSDEVETSALSIIDSTDDVFQEFCDAQVELVGRALGARLLRRDQAHGARPTQVAPQEDGRLAQDQAKERRRRPSRRRPSRGLAACALQ